MNTIVMDSKTLLRKRSRKNIDDNEEFYANDDMRWDFWWLRSRPQFGSLMTARVDCAGFIADRRADNTFYYLGLACMI